MAKASLLNFACDEERGICRVQSGDASKSCDSMSDQQETALKLHSLMHEVRGGPDSTKHDSSAFGLTQILYQIRVL